MGYAQWPEKIRLHCQWCVFLQIWNCPWQPKRTAWCIINPTRSLVAAPPNNHKKSTQSKQNACHIHTRHPSLTTSTVTPKSLPHRKPGNLCERYSSLIFLLLYHQLTLTALKKTLERWDFIMCFFTLGFYEDGKMICDQFFFFFQE